MASRATKSGRIELRADPSSEKRIRLAATLARQTVSTFMLEAASERADQVIAKTRELLVPADYFDAFWKAISKAPRANRKLAAASKRARRFVQRW